MFEKGGCLPCESDNTYLAAIENGYQGDPIKFQPFDRVFTCENIWKWWCKVGFIPKTCNTLYDQQVQQQLGGKMAVVGDNGKSQIAL